MQAIRHFTLALVSLILLALVAAPAQANTYTWDAEGGTNAMSDTANWFDGVGDPANTTFLTGGANTDLVFGSAGSSAHPGATNYSVNGMTFTRAFTIGNSESGSAITIGAGGVTMDNTVDGEVLLRWGLKLNTNTSFQNNSAHDFVSLRGFQADSPLSITNKGSGTNWIRLRPNGSGLTGNVTLIQDSLTSKVSLEINGTVAGKLEIRKGLFAWTFSGNPATGDIVLGSATAAPDDWATLGFRHNTSLGPGTISGTHTVSQAIVLAGTVGTNTIASGKRTYGGSFAAVNHTINWTGGVTGSNSLYLENVVDTNGDDNIQFSGNSINMTGKLIHVGAGTGTCTIDSVIGANVTEVIQDSATSRMILGAANEHTGNTTVLAGTLDLNHVDAVKYSTLDVGASGQVGFVVADGPKTYNLGGLTGSGNLAIGGNTLSIGGNGQTTSYGGGIGGSGGGLTKVGGGTLTLSGTSSYTGATQVNNGTLLILGTITSDTTVADGAAIGGGGTIDGSLTLSDGAQFLFDPLAILTVNGGTVTLGALSIADIVGLDATTPDGTYTLIDGSAAFIFDGVAHLGLANAYDFGIDKKIAYFEQGSLILVVATIPEPASAALLALAGLAALRRRSREA